MYGKFLFITNRGLLSITICHQGDELDHLSNFSKAKNIFIFYRYSCDIE